MISDSPQSSFFEEGKHEELLELARRGCRDSLNHLLQGCWHYLLVVAKDSLGADLYSKVSPSDLVQQTLLVGYTKFPAFTGETRADLLRWFEEILRNQAMHAGRAFRTTLARNIDLETSLEISPAIPDATSPNPPQVLAEKQQAALIQTAILRLPPQYREMIVLRSIHSLSFDEIGLRTGRSADASRKLWVTALKVLKELLVNGSISFP